MICKEHRIDLLVDFHLSRSPNTIHSAITTIMVMWITMGITNNSIFMALFPKGQYRQYPGTLQKITHQNNPR